ncbi:MAG: hypothetical protein Q4A32_05255, partial [Lachnospiraceae bacterium]|nr:hypothetical protein [Lachnospiraceae bacterium]
MKMAPGFLSEKIPGREKINAIFADELKAHLFAFCLITLCMEACLLAEENRFANYALGLPLHEVSLLDGIPAAGLAADLFPRGAFVLSALVFFFLFCVLEYLFKLFLGRYAASFLSLFPAVLFLHFLRDAEEWAFLRGAVLAAASCRLFFIAVRLYVRKSGQQPEESSPTGREGADARAFAFSVFLLDAAALCLRFAGHVLDGTFSTDRYLFIALAVLTLAALQRILCERNGSGFPFFYFALLGVILTMLPMRAEPIDWSPLVQTGERLAGRAADAADYVSYYLSPFLPNDSYTAGYSSLSGTGGRVSGSEKTQIILRTKEKPYYLYEDNETSQKRKVRRTVYLAGGEGVDKAGLVAFLRFLYGSGVDREYASLFSKISKVDVEYAYLETADVIAPAHAILLRDETGAVEDGVSPTRHKRGYRISSVYLDIDYGSPYLADLLRKKGDDYSDTELSYDTACSYMRELYGFDMGSLLTRGEYERLQPAGTVLLGQKNLAQ